MKNLNKLLLILPLVMMGQKKDTIRMYFLGGQSNMDGYGKVKELKKTDKKGFDNTWIFHGNTVNDGHKQGKGGLGIWSKLQPGHGANFHSDGKTNQYSHRFGLELTFAKTLQEKYPNQKIALIKYSKGGTSIDAKATGRFGCWEMDYRDKDGLNQYDFFLNTVKNALSVKDINGDGVEDVLIPCGILWMQGEADGSFTKEIALEYYDNLTILMNQVRSAFWKDDIPVVIGKISDSYNSVKKVEKKIWEHGELVQYAQERFAKEDKNAAIVRSTKNYKYSDPWHYNTAGYLDMGKQFAEKVYLLNQSK